MRLFKAYDDYYPFSSFKGIHPAHGWKNGISIVIGNHEFKATMEDMEHYHWFAENFAKDMVDDPTLYPQVVDLIKYMEDGGLELV